MGRLEPSTHSAGTAIVLQSSLNSMTAPGESNEFSTQPLRRLGQAAAKPRRPTSERASRPPNNSCRICGKAFAINLPQAELQGEVGRAKRRPGGGRALWFVVNVTHRHLREDFVERWLLLLNVRSLMSNSVLNVNSEFTTRGFPPPGHCFARPDPSLAFGGRG